MSGDAPHFPPPGRKEAYRAPAVTSPSTSPKVVTRAEPPPSSGHPARVALTKDEMRALIAVEAAKRPPWRSSLRRSAILLPVSLVVHLLGTSVWALVIGVVLYVAALAWIARPLFRRDDFT
jgi:hypothetical protein